MKKQCRGVKNGDPVALTLMIEVWIEGKMVSAAEVDMCKNCAMVWP